MEGLQGTCTRKMYKESEQGRLKGRFTMNVYKEGVQGMCTKMM